MGEVVKLKPPPADMVDQIITITVFAQVPRDQFSAVKSLGETYSAEMAESLHHLGAKKICGSLEIAEVHDVANDG